MSRVTFANQIILPSNNNNIAPSTLNPAKASLSWNTLARTPGIL
jgi:hypothetical protein